jgi:hypothetical protein
MRNKKECLELMIKNNGECSELCCINDPNPDKCPFDIPGTTYCKMTNASNEIKYKASIKLYVKLYGKGALTEFLL